MAGIPEFSWKRAAVLESSPERATIPPFGPGRDTGSKFIPPSSTLVSSSLPSPQLNCLLHYGFLNSLIRHGSPNCLLRHGPLNSLIYREGPPCLRLVPALHQPLGRPATICHVHIPVGTYHVPVFISSFAHLSNNYLTCISIFCPHLHSYFWSCAYPIKVSVIACIEVCYTCD